MRPHVLAFGFATALLLVVAGCVTIAPASTGPSTGLAKDAAGLKDGPAPPLGPVPRTEEHLLHVTAYAQAPGLGKPTDTTNMHDADLEVKVPEGAHWARVTATWTPSDPAAPEQGLMFHQGSLDKVGELLGKKVLGSSPIATNWTLLPEDAKALVIMCHVYSTPDQLVAAEVQQDTNLKVEFA